MSSNDMNNKPIFEYAYSSWSKLTENINRHCDATDYILYNIVITWENLLSNGSFTHFQIPNAR